jgi:hypothetical protein
MATQSQQTHDSDFSQRSSRCLNQSRNKRCFCPKLTGGFRLHQAACPLYNRSWQSKARSKRLVFSSPWLGLSAEAAIFISTGAGGLSISPTLRFHPIVPYDSPAFNILSRMLYCSSNTADQILFINKSIIRDLQKAFDEGVASPYDRTANGFTLLHASPNPFKIGEIAWLTLLDGV